MRGESAALSGAILMDGIVEQTPPVLLVTFQTSPTGKAEQGVRSDLAQTQDFNYHQPQEHRVFGPVTVATPDHAGACPMGLSMWQKSLYCGYIEDRKHVSSAREDDKASRSPGW